MCMKRHIKMSRNKTVGYVIKKTRNDENNVINRT